MKNNISDFSFFVFSLGCKVNSYESFAVKNLLLEKGLRYDDLNPDIVIINTCSVTSVADQKSRQHIRHYRKMFPDSIICVMGCYSQKEYDFIQNNLPFDILVGTTNKYLIYDLIKKFIENGHQKIVDINKNIKNFKYEEICKTAYVENCRAYLKIQDGCDNFCSYCIIPYLRGKPRSRPLENVINEARYIVSLGIKEIVISGIHIGKYGYDLDNVNFSKLIEEILNIDGLKRLTISSIEASEIDDNLIELFGKYNNLAKHIHIPLQSGSESVLESMNRKYTKEEFLNKIRKIKLMCPDIAITTDVIVGFPGETDKDFIETINFIKEAKFAMLHVFPYSKRKGTAAFLMQNQVNDFVKKERAKVLRELSDELYSNFCDSQKGKKLHILIESFDKSKEICVGHSENYIKVEINSNVDLTNKIIEIIY